MAGATEPHFVAQHFSEPCDPPREDSVAFDCAIFLFFYFSFPLKMILTS